MSKDKRETEKKDVAIECHCRCHTDKNVIHVVACCRGQCPHCGRWFKQGLSDHISACTAQTRASSGWWGLRLIYSGCSAN